VKWVDRHTELTKNKTKRKTARTANLLDNDNRIRIAKVLVLSTHTSVLRIFYEAHTSHGAHLNTSTPTYPRTRLRFLRTTSTHLDTMSHPSRYVSFFLLLLVLAVVIALSLDFALGYESILPSPCVSACLSVCCFRSLPHVLYIKMSTRFVSIVVVVVVLSLLID